MLCVVLLALVASASAMPLTPMDQVSLDSFTKMFRKTLLDKVAVEWNTTLTMTNTLKSKMSTCNTTINRQVESCKTCTQSTCQQNPSFSDYLALANPYTYLEGPLNDLTSKFADVANLLGDEAGSFFSGIKDVAGSTANQFASSITDTFNTALSGLSSLGGQLTDAGKDIGNALEHAGSSIGHAIGSIFGKRELDPKVVECMQKCAPCKPLLLPKDQMVSQVCGAEIINMNNTITARVNKIKGIYDASLDTTHPILAKVEYDMTSANPQMQLTRVFLTVRLNGHEVRYQTSIPYAMMQIPQTAHDMALEYWNKVQ